MKKFAAVDLWGQMLERARQNDWSTFIDPDHEESEERKAQIEQGFLDSGWTREDIEHLSKIDSERALSAPVTSPGVSRQSEFMLKRLTDMMAGGLSEAQRNQSSKVHFAVEPKAGPFVSTVNVIMTDQVVITMGTHFTRFCGLISRAYIRTCNLQPFNTGTECNKEILVSCLRDNPKLILYWWRILFSFALTGTHALTNFAPSSPREVLLMEQMAAAMEIFALAHELGHHCLSHGRRLTDTNSAKQEEFEADQFAVDLCENTEKSETYQRMQGYRMSNPYLWTGSGGILLLGSIDIFRRIKGKIYGENTLDTHPSFSSRASMIKNSCVLQPLKHATKFDFCISVENIIERVSLEIDRIINMESFIRNLNIPQKDWEHETHNFSK